MKKSNETKSALRYVITAIVAIILILVILLLFRSFKYTPSSTKNLKGNIKKYATKLEKHGDDLIDELTENINERGTILESVKENQLLNHRETLAKINSAEAAVEGKINDSEKNLSKEIKDAKDEVNKNVIDSKDEINKNINDSKEEIKENTNAAKEEIIENTNAAKEEINENVSEKAEDINDNVDHTRRQLREMITTSNMINAFNFMLTNNNIISARDAIQRDISNLSGQVASAKEEIKGNTNAAKAAIQSDISNLSDQVTNAERNINNNIDSARRSINTTITIENILTNLNINRVSGKIDTLSQTMTRRFNQVDKEIIDLSSDLASNTQNLSELISTNAGLISESLDDISGNVDEILEGVEEINDTKLGTFTDGSTVYSKLFNLGNMVYKLNQKADTANTDIQIIKENLGTYSDTRDSQTLFGLNKLTLEKVQNVGNMVHTNFTNINTANTNITLLSTVVGTQEDTSAANTLFGKTTLLVEKVTGIEGTLTTIEGKIDTANSKLDSLTTAVGNSVNPITNNVIEQAIANSGNGNANAKITNAINWLIRNGYARD